MAESWGKTAGAHCCYTNFFVLRNLTWLLVNLCKVSTFHALQTWRTLRQTYYIPIRSRAQYNPNEIWARVQEHTSKFVCCWANILIFQIKVFWGRYLPHHQMSLLIFHENNCFFFLLIIVIDFVSLPRCILRWT